MKLVETFLFCWGKTIRCDVSAGCHDVDARLSAGGAGALCSLLDGRYWQNRERLHVNLCYDI